MAFQQQPYTATRSMPNPGPTAFQQLPPPPQPRPLYFISRHTGIMVPLVPADELPFNVRLAGVPRVLRMEETYGMQHVGMAPYTGMTFQLEREIHMGMEAPEMGGQRGGSQPAHAAPGHSRSLSGTPVKYLAPDAHARQALAQSAAYNGGAFAANGALPVRPVSAHETATSWRSGFNPSAHTPSVKTLANLPSSTGTTDKTQALLDAIVASTSGAESAARLGYTPRSAIPLPPAGALPDAEKKEYCTYWLRHGECDYMQQGCLYKHEMPDRETLLKIGFRGTPWWWVERQAMMPQKREIVGEVVKSEEWLKRGGGEESESESESEVEETPSQSSKESENGEVKEEGEKEKSAVVKERTTPEPVQAAIEPKIATTVDRPAAAATAKAASTSTRAPPPPAIDIRKASTTSDLISFASAVPLLPTPPSSTPSLTPDSSPRQGQLTPVTPPTPLTPGTPTEPAVAVATAGGKAAKVFVPKGESPEQHIAEAKKRQAARQFARRGAPVSTIVGPIVPLERQIADMQRAKEGKGRGERKGREVVGLMGSQHAPVKVGAGEEKCGGQPREQRFERVERKQAMRTGMRMRRPAAVVTAAPVKILKKEVVGEKK